jgi:hypothetical protein
MRKANEPFEFVAASYLIQICRERANTLGELESYLRSVPDGSIFYHTFQSLESHHYTAFSSDFAQWVMAACNEAALAERLAALDLREFVSLADLREVLVRRAADHLRQYPQSSQRPAFEPFHFCEAIEVAVPLDARAYNVNELADGIRRLSLQTLHHHFINSRLRLALRTNDFSNWIDCSLGLPELAAKLNRIDFYSSSLEGLRQQVLRMLEGWRDQ